MSEIILDSLPTPGYTLQKRGKTYLDEKAVKTAKKNPGKFIPLRDGHLVDKAYLGSLEDQAAKIDPCLEVHFVPEKRERNTNTASGKPSYSYKGLVFARYLHTATVAPANKAKKAKKAKHAAA